MSAREALTALAEGRNRCSFAPGVLIYAMEGIVSGMTIEPNDLQSRLRVFLELQGAGVTDEELSHMAESYRQCLGKEHWDVREYVRRTGVGAREYRVVRGSGVQDVYRSAERARASAVRTALNELETQEKSGEAPIGVTS
jgi:hypothetical protein